MLPLLSPRVCAENKWQQTSEGYGAIDAVPFFSPEAFVVFLSVRKDSRDRLFLICEPLLAFTGLAWQHVKLELITLASTDELNSLKKIYNLSSGELEDSILNVYHYRIFRRNNLRIYGDWNSSCVIIKLKFHNIDFSA